MSQYTLVLPNYEPSVTLVTGSGGPCDPLRNEVPSKDPTDETQDEVGCVEPSRLRSTVSPLPVIWRTPCVSPYHSFPHDDRSTGFRLSVERTLDGLPRGCGKTRSGSSDGFWFRNQDNGGTQCLRLRRETSSGRDGLNVVNCLRRRDE